MDSVRDSSLEEGLRETVEDVEDVIAEASEAQCADSGCYVKRSSDAASGWNPSAYDQDEISAAAAANANVDVHGKWGMSCSIMACAQAMERPGLDHGPEFMQAERAAERQCRQTWVMAIHSLGDSKVVLVMTTMTGDGWFDLCGLAREILANNRKMVWRSSTGSRQAMDLSIRTVKIVSLKEGHGSRCSNARIRAATICRVRP